MDGGVTGVGDTCSRGLEFMHQGDGLKELRVFNLGKKKRTGRIQSRLPMSH